MQRTLVILNPAARSERAAALAAKIEEIVGGAAAIRMTSGSGEALAMAREAVTRKIGTIVAAGGDGTVNEIVNGIAGTDVILGVLPAGSMNVFAVQLGLPKGLKECWEVIQAGHTREVDLARASGRCFVQMAGVGLDAQVVMATPWEFKRNFGPLSYLVSAAQVAARTPPHLTIRHDGGVAEGSFVLIGNGRYYGGPFPVFPSALIDDGLLEVLVFKNLGYFDLVRYLHGVLFGTHVDFPDVDYFQAHSVTVESAESVPVEVDGEVIGTVPVTFDFHPRRLKVLTPEKG